MLLKRFESAWKQIKLSNAMKPIDSQEILSIIANAEDDDKTKLPVVVLNVFVYSVLIILFQGG